VVVVGELSMRRGTGLEGINRRGSERMFDGHLSDVSGDTRLSWIVRFDLGKGGISWSCSSSERDGKLVDSADSRSSMARMMKR